MAPGGRPSIVAQAHSPRAWTAPWLLLLLASSCAIRSATADHYVGPVLYRRGTPCRDGADVTEVVQVGGAAETGREWGVSLGVIERVAATPRDAARAPAFAWTCTPRSVRSRLEDTT